MSHGVNSGSEVLLELHDGWAEVVLNRPERKNAITGPLGEGLADALNRCEADDAVRAVLLRGAEGSFCSGLDLKEFGADPEPDWKPRFQTIWRGAHRALFDCSKPVIGGLERFAINGGAALALACDLLVVGEGAFLQVGEVQIGMAAPYNVAWLNLRVPESIAAEIVLVGDRLDAARLDRYHLAHTVCADDAVLAEARALTERIAGFPEGVSRIKRSLRSRVQMSADDWFDQVFEATNTAG